MVNISKRKRQRNYIKNFCMHQMKRCANLLKKVKDFVMRVCAWNINAHHYTNWGKLLADKYKQIVGLKDNVHNESWILHMSSSVSQYSAACLISSKHQYEIVQDIYLIWIADFGIPKKFLSNNVGEFFNDKYREMKEQYPD